MILTMTVGRNGSRLDGICCRNYQHCRIGSIDGSLCIQWKVSPGCIRQGEQVLIMKQFGIVTKDGMRASDFGRITLGRQYNILFDSSQLQQSGIIVAPSPTNQVSEPKMIIVKKMSSSFPPKILQSLHKCANLEEMTWVLNLKSTAKLNHEKNAMCNPPFLGSPSHYHDLMLDPCHC